jgi:hypothetical protein
VVNASVRYADKGISITNGATSTTGSSSFGLVVSRSTLASTKTDGVVSSNTAISVTDSTISGGVHGANITLTNAPGTPAALRLSGNRFTSQGAEAILGQGLYGQQVWITDNRIQNAGTFGMRLLSADGLVLRNNDVSASGGGPSAEQGRYPAIYLNAVSADFVRNVRGNVGGGNGLDAIAFDGTVSGNLNWITPSNRTGTHPLGYLLDGGLTLPGGTLNVNAGDVVKSLGGPITINGGAVIVSGSATPLNSPTSRSAIFTSLKDNPANPSSQVDASDAAAVSCPSVLVSICTPGPGDWGGLVITRNTAGSKGSGAISYGLINYANTGISLDSGPISASPESSNFRLTVSNNTLISNTSKDGINSLDTPFSVDSSTIQNAGANGIIGSFFSPANCAATPGTCERMNVVNVHITGSGKDGIIANGLAEQPVTISGDTVTGAGAYGIRLVGADQVALTDNTVNTSGLASSAYPAIYLNNVVGDFNTAITGNLGAGNGLNALVFHGTVNTTTLHPAFIWLTPDPTGINPLGYMLDGGLTVNGNVTATGGVVKVLSGGIKINGSLTSSGTTYTSMKENVAPLACNTVYVPAPCPVAVPSSDYWGGIVVDPIATTSFQGGGIRLATSGLTVYGPLNLSGASIHDVTGTAVSSPSGTLAIDCSRIEGNGIGVSAGASATITQSDIFNNATYDLVAPSGASATYDWWGPGGGNFGTTPPGVVANKLTSQQPVATLTLADDVLTATHAFAIGNMTVTADFSRRMTPDPTTPVAQFALPADPPPPHGLTGSWAASQRWTTTPYALNLGTASEGKNTLTMSGARSCVPDPATNLMTPATQDFTAAIEPTSLSVAPSSATYGGATTLSATLTDPGIPLPNGKVTFSVSGYSAGSQNTDNSGIAVVNNVTVAGINAGSHPDYVVAAYGGDNTFSPSSGTGLLTIAKAPLIVTADNQSRAYGAGNPSLTVTPTGLVNGDTLVSIGVSPSLSTAATTTSPVASYAISISGSASTTNYAITYVSGTLMVTQAGLTITADNQSRAYGAGNPSLTVTPTGLVNGDTLVSIVVTPALTTTALTTSGVGSYAISITGPASTTNYAISYGTGTLTVTQAGLTITAQDASRSYGAANPSFTVTYSGFVNGETASSLGGVVTFTAPATASSVGTYTGQIVPSGLTSTNYAITYVNGTLTITQAALTITADDQSRAYGAGNPSLTVTPTGLVNGDTLVSIGVTPALTTIALTTTGVGSYPISISGPASTINYAISYLGGTLTITAAGTSVTVSALPEPSTAGSIDTLSATVATTVAGGINPNTEGTVTFSEAGTTLCTTGTLSGNTASCTYNAFLAGTHTITATYNPSANFLTGSSTNFHLVS